MDRIVYIYALLDPKTNEVRYVGKTTKEPKERYNQHLTTSKKRKTYVNIWVNDLLNDGFKPIMKVLDSCVDCDWVELERKWTVKLYEENNKLCNLTYIGDKEDRNPNLSVNVDGFRKKDKIYEEVTWLKKNTNLSSNDIRDLYGKKDWNKYTTLRRQESRQKIFNTKKYGNMLELHPKIKNHGLSDMEKFIWYCILQMNWKKFIEVGYAKALIPLIKKDGEFYDKLFYIVDGTVEYYVSVIKEISNKLLDEVVIEEKIVKEVDEQPTDDEEPYTLFDYF